MFLRALFLACRICAAVLGLSLGMAWAQPVAPGPNQAIPPGVQGPFVSNPAIVTELDCPGG